VIKEGAMRTRIVRIGSSRGLRIPNALLEASGIRETVDVSVEDGRPIVRPVPDAREGWAEAVQVMAERGED
jgi:antitoxin MazE